MFLFACSFASAASPDALVRTAERVTDYSAYTARFGEIRIGLGDVTVGALPRVEVGTNVALDAVGAFNAHAKVNPLRVGGFDLALEGSGWRYDRYGTDMASWSARAQATYRLLPRWSLHAGAGWTAASSSGLPEVDSLVPRLPDVGPVDPSAVTEAGVSRFEELAGFAGSAGLAVVSAATDVRVTRTTSIVLQGAAVVGGHADVSDAVPGYLTGGFGLDPAEAPSPGGAWIGSAAWQLESRHVELRLGVGLSSTPGAWLTQSVRLGYRFGGGKEERTPRGAAVADSALVQAAPDP